MEDKGLMLWGKGLELLWLERKTELIEQNLDGDVRSVLLPIPQLVLACVPICCLFQVHALDSSLL